MRMAPELSEDSSSAISLYRRKPVRAARVLLTVVAREAEAVSPVWAGGGGLRFSLEQFSDYSYFASVA
jgi:hypothetical protein